MRRTIHGEPGSAARPLVAGHLLVLAQHVVVERSLERIAIAPLVRTHLNHVRS